MKIKEIIDEITAEQGTNAKIELIKKYKSNPIFERVLYLTYSRRIKFYLKQIPEYTTSIKTSPIPLETALLGLDELIYRRLTGHAGIAHLKMILEAIDPQDAEVIVKIIKRDLKLGTATTSINKAMPGLIEKEPYMGGIPYNEKDAADLFRKGGYAICDVKEDGRFQNNMIRGGEVDMTSRPGEVVYLPDAPFVQELSQLEDCVLTGELVVPGIPRYKSNGLINAVSVINRKKSEGLETRKEEVKFAKEEGLTVKEFTDRIELRVWDVITPDEFFAKFSPIPLLERRKRVEKILENTKMTRCVKYRLVHSLKEAKEHFAEMLEAGEEGTMLKDPKAAWKDGKRKTSIKMKLEMNVDMKVTAFNYGNPGTKNENVISAIQCESRDGKVRSVCAGIKEADMKYIEANQASLLGKIIDVKSCGITTRDGKSALLHPVFIEFRTDKFEADSYEEIVKIEAGVKGLS